MKCDSRKKSLLLVTRGFPYGTCEKSFWETEFRVLCDSFDVHIFAEETDKLDQYWGPEFITHERFKWTRNYGDILRALLCKDMYLDLYNMYKNRHLPDETGITPNLRKGSIKLLQKTAWAKQIMRRMRQLVKEYKIEIIYSLWCDHFTYAAIWIKDEFPELKVVSRFHAYDLYIEWAKNVHYEFYRELVSHKLDELLFISAHGQKYFKDRWNRIGKVMYLGAPKYHRIDNDYKGKFLLVSCSTLIPRKRVHLIIEALSLIPDPYVIEWYHIGKGSLREQLEDYADALLSGKTNIRYCFEGWMDPAKIMPTYDSLKPSLFISTTKLEGLPVSMMEALSGGIPIIGPQVQGVPECVKDNETGFILSPDPSPKEISEAVINYYNLPVNEKFRLSQNCIDLWSKLFDAEKNAEGIAKELSLLCSS